MYSVSGTVLGAKDDAENKTDISALKGFAVWLQRQTFIQIVFIEHLHSEPGIQQRCTKPTIRGIGRLLLVVIGAMMGKPVQVS